MDFFCDLWYNKVMDNKSTVDKVFETLSLEDLGAKTRENTARERRREVRAKRLVVFAKGTAVAVVAVLMMLAGAKIVRIFSAPDQGAVAEEEIEVEFSKPEEDAVEDTAGEQVEGFVVDTETGDVVEEKNTSNVRAEKSQRRTKSTSTAAMPAKTSTTTSSSAATSSTMTTSKKTVSSSASVVVNGEPPVIESYEPEQGDEEPEDSGSEFRDKANSQED